MVKTFEVYVYLDPRSPGKFIYGDLIFDHLPVYIGRGCVQQRRKFKHLTKSSNIHLRHLIEKLKRENIQPIIITISDNLTLEESVTKEMDLIKQVGRQDLGAGPLYNFCDGGGGIPGIKLTDEQKRRRGESTRKYFSNMTEEQRKEHGLKSKQNKTTAGIEAGKQKFQQYIKNLTDAEKHVKEQKRYNAWCAAYYNRTTDNKQLTSSKCSNASYKKPQHYITILDCISGCIQSKFLVEWMKTHNFAKDGIMDKINSQDFKTPLCMRKCKKNIIVLSAVKRPPTEEEYKHLITIL
jgi:hypothetical protein